jgi:Transglycosylase SLT domain
MRRLLQLGLLFLSASAFAADTVTTRTVYDTTLRNGFTIRHVRQEVLGDVTRLYTNEQSFLDVPTAEVAETIAVEEQVKSNLTPELRPQSVDLNDVVKNASDKHLIDPDLIHAVIRAESGFNPNARSPKGAQGLMQLMPDTASQLGVTNAYDPAINVNAGTQYLRSLLLQYDGDLIKALAAYNAGPGRVQQYHGVPPFRETRNYVARIVREFNEKKLAEQKAHAKLSAAKRNSAASASSGSTSSTNAQRGK